MSWDRCKNCDRPVNTDDDPDCYIEVGNMRKQTTTECICEPCREELEIERERTAQAGRS
jgi:hypothetical protein